MAKEEDRKKIKRLRDEIETLKNEGHDHQHPKFKEWRDGITTVLKKLYGDNSRILKRFDALQFQPKGNRMWEQDYDHDRAGKGRAYFKEELGRARVILDEVLEKDKTVDKEEKGIDEEEFISSVREKSLEEKSTQAAEALNQKTSVEEAVDMESEEKIEGLLEQLREELKDPGADLTKVQGTMEELMKVKRKEAILQRLLLEAKDPKAPWRRIKELMKGVWKTDRKLLLENLPDLLED
jgi:hypothetical protein